MVACPSSISAAVATSRFTRAGGIHAVVHGELYDYGHYRAPARERVCFCGKQRWRSRHCLVQTLRARIFVPCARRVCLCALGREPPAPGRGPGPIWHPVTVLHRVPGQAAGGDRDQVISGVWTGAGMVDQGPTSRGCTGCVLLLS